MNFIQGEMFPLLSNFIYSDNNVDDYNPLINTFNIKNLKEHNIIYCHTNYINLLFSEIKNLEHSFTIISHNSDQNIVELDNLPNNVKKWHSQNMCINDERVDVLPIGLENNRWFINLKKKEKMTDIIKTNKNYKNLVYVNHNINTNVKERTNPYYLLNKQKWATVEFGLNGSNFDTYLNNIYNHKFVISPAGNGIDTHRKWECLYLNTIPIEKRNGNNKYFEDLPICFVDDWEEITQSFLETEYERITHINWNLEKMAFNYWKNKII